MHQAFSVHTFGHTGFTQQVDGALFKHTGTDAAEYIFGGLTFDDHGVDTGVVQQLTK
ncbi:hypothetical protein D3C75_1331560 [compost metagenome]